MKKNSTLITLIIFLLSVVTNLCAQKPISRVKPTTRILFVFDASNSMFGKWQGEIKMDLARKLFTQLLDSLASQKELELGLRVYGHQKPYPPQDCDDSKLEVPIAKNNIENIKKRIAQIKPSGTTPISLSLQRSAADFVPKPNCKNIVILITDGIEACDGDPCAVSLALQKKGIILKPFIVGIGSDAAEFKKGFDCVGTYFDATDEKTFFRVMNVIITQALYGTTAQVNLLDAYSKANETNVAMTFIDENSGITKYDYMHTINSRGEPDTIVLDPAASYKLLVHTIPPVEKRNIKINAGRHNIIAVDCPRGSITSKVSTLDYKNLNFIIRKKGEQSTMHVMQMGETEKLLVGKYDLEMLTLPRLKIKEVDISQNKTTTIEIPLPGVLNILYQSVGYGTIYKDDDTRDFVCSLKENVLQEKIVLQPGKYKLVYRPKSAKETLYTVEKEFKIDSGLSVQLKTF